MWCDLLCIVKSDLSDNVLEFVNLSIILTE